MYENRDVYRKTIRNDRLCFFNAAYKETELYVGALDDLKTKALIVIKKRREELDAYIRGHADFLESFVPVKAGDDAPEMVKRMCAAARKAGVGPMAAVAGAFSEFVGQELLKDSIEIVVENGGDIFICSPQKKTIAVYAGASPLSMTLGIRIDPEDMPLGICTSAGTIGHSVSMGRADAAVAVSADTCLADACATRLGNMIKTPKDIGAALEEINQIEGLLGALAIAGESVGAIGDIEIVVL